MSAKKTKRVKKTLSKSAKRPTKPIAKSAQEQAYEDIESGRVPHDKWNCPGCPIH